VALSNELIGRVLGGRYLLRALVGTGASARVYLADDTTLRRQVAVKVLHESLAHDDTFLRRFRKEAQAAAALNHPNVLAVYDWGQDDVPYIVTEYLGGGSLRNLLDAGHRLSLSQALLVGLEAARGLDYAHRRGLVHRDIKPANLLFDEERRLRIADFGLARALAEAGITEPSGSLVGTVRYASPEQAKGESLTGKTDVYSLALVLIECVTGEVPFGADTALGSLLARVDQQVPVPAALGPLRPALERAGRPDPADRPDAEELAISLMAAAADLARPEPLPIVGALAGIDPTATFDRTLLHAPADLDVSSPAHAHAGAPLRAGAADVTDVGPLAVAGGPVATGAFGTAGPATGGAGAGPAGGPKADAAQADATQAMQVSTGVEPTRAFERPGRASPGAGEPPADDHDRHRRRWPWVLLGIVLLAGAVSGAVYASFTSRTITHPMPELVGQDRAALVELAAKNKWVLAKPAERRSDQYPTPGQLIEVLPPAGTKVAEGATIEFTVSLGPQPVPIPKLVGRTLDEARTELERVRLKLADPVKVFDETVEAGRILSVDTVGVEAPPGTAIVVKVSDGPAPRTIPAELVGRPEAEVNAKLAELKLTPVKAEEYSDTVPAGSVVRFDPAAGSQVARGAQVQVVVSKGKEPKPIPATFGKTPTEAAAILRAAGFEPGNTIGAPDRTVIVTDPPVGSLRVPGTKVDIITGSR
jgi:beta-lactam-binding protein with PASTA domain/tRNA A-37 threonylcarbamoyl transferase component Bud32